MTNIQDTYAGKMSSERSHQTPEKTSAVSSKKSAKSKTMDFQFLDLRGNGPNLEKSWVTDSPLPTGHLMRQVGEYPREENASTLSQILQDGVPEKYFLSPKACQGILRRASERGKELPEVLRLALEWQAADMS